MKADLLGRALAAVRRQTRNRSVYSSSAKAVPQGGGELAAGLIGYATTCSADGKLVAIPAAKLDVVHSVRLVPTRGTRKTLPIMK